MDSSDADTPAFDFPRMTETLERLRLGRITIERPAAREPVSGGGAESPWSELVAQLEEQPPFAEGAPEVNASPPGLEIVHWFDEPMLDAAHGVAELPTAPTAGDPLGGSVDAAAIAAELGTLDIAREALRARFIAFGEARNQRSAYEWVFIMLAFAVMVLLVTPPLTDLLLAARGISPR